MNYVNPTSIVNSKNLHSFNQWACWNGWPSTLFEKSCIPCFRCAVLFTTWCWIPQKISHLTLFLLGKTLFLLPIAFFCMQLPCFFSLSFNFCMLSFCYCSQWFYFCSHLFVNQPPVYIIQGAVYINQGAVYINRRLVYKRCSQIKILHTIISLP